jgi:hypothetical protein
VTCSNSFSKDASFERLAKAVWSAKHRLAVGGSTKNATHMNPYLMDAPHWRIEGVGDFPRVFLALLDLLPAGSIIGLAGGSLSPEVRSFFDKNAIPLDPAVFASLPEGNFAGAFFVPVDRQRMTELAAIAEHHAEPEIALHMAAISNGSSIFEWFDAPDDPISISLLLTEDAVSRFAYAAGGTWAAAPAVGQGT